MRPMSTMYTQDATVVVFTKALYTCATLYSETTMLTKATLNSWTTLSTKKTMSPMATAYTRHIEYTTCTMITKITLKTIKTMFKMNRIILFTNIKGGVGKTSTCALFAQYLYESGYPVMALDADIQASLSRHRERELAANPDVAVSWDVSTIDTTDRQSLQSAGNAQCLQPRSAVSGCGFGCGSHLLRLRHHRCHGYLHQGHQASEGYTAGIPTQPHQLDGEPCRRDEAARRDGKNSWQNRKGHAKDQAERRHQAILDRFPT